MKQWMKGFAAAGILLAAVSCKSETYGDWNEIQGEWRVVRVGTWDLPAPDSLRTGGREIPFLGFEPTEHRIYGYAGCNRIVGGYIVAEKTDEADFSGVGTTLMMCPDMSVEDALLPALRRVARYEVLPDGRLCLLDRDGESQVELVALEPDSVE